MSAISAARGVTQFDNNGPMAGPEQIMRLGDELARVIGESVEALTDLPAAGAKLNGAENWPGRLVYVEQENAYRGWSGSDWQAGFGTDAAGWSYRTSIGGKRQYFRFYDSWAGSAFGPAGGSNWSQSRAANIAPPTGKTWDSFLVSVDVWPQATTQNATQAIIAGYLSGSTGSAASTLLFYNPTTLTIPNTFMNLRASIILTEK